MKVLFCTSTLPGAVLIRAVTWSSWSHVALVLDNGNAIEATYPKVREVPLEIILHNRKKWAIVDIPTDNDKLIEEYARSQVGKPYDITALLGILVHRQWTDEDSWFCSELVANSFTKGNYSLFREDVIHRITPQNLWMLNYPIIRKSE